MAKAIRATVLLATLMLAVVPQTAWAKKTMYVIAKELSGTISISQVDANNYSSDLTVKEIRLTFYYGERPSGYTEGSEVWKQRTASIGGSCIFDVPTSDDRPAWYVNTYDANVARRQEAVVEVVFDASFAAAQPTSTAYWFNFMKNLKGLNLLNLNVAKLKYAQNMFNNCYSLEIIYCEGDWSDKSITSSWMFHGCAKLPGYEGKDDKTKARPYPDGYFTTTGLTYNKAGKYYEIKNEQDLIHLGDFAGNRAASHCEGMTFKLTADLDFTNMPDRRENGNSGNFHPIGLVEDDSFGGYFSGHFDGQGHTIKALRYTNKIALGNNNGNNNVQAGLFNIVEGSSAVVERVMLIDPQFSGKKSASGGIAGIIGNAATIRNCTVLGGSINDDASSGGIVGSYSSNAETIEGCTVIGTSVGHGMIIGRGNTNSQPTIKDCIYYDPDGKGIAFCTYTDGGGNQRVYQLTLGDGITTTDATYSHALLPGKAYFTGGAAVTLGHARSGYMLKAYESSNVTINGNTFTMPASDVSVTATWYELAHFGYDEDPLVDGSAEHPYIISTADGWNFFCDVLAENKKGFFGGKTVKLGADIGTAQEPITRMAGGSSHDFTGTFDGGGHTLTVSYGSYGSPVAEDKAAPFRNVESGCVIENLHVAGDIYTSAQFAGGIVGTQYGAVTIRNCHVSTVIDGTHGGIVGLNGDGNGSALTIEGCVFDGKLLTEGATATATCAGFVGYKHRSVTITNSLYAPATLSDGETEIATGATFARNWTMPADANCYYTRTLGDAQGKAAYVYTPAAEGFVPQNVGAGGTAYSVSGITAYADGLKYNGKFYLVKAAVSLADNAANSGNITDGQVADVTLQDRTLYKDGSWNTICLPFSLSAEQIAANAAFAGATLMTMDVKENNGFDTTDGTLYLSFQSATAIEAGMPYLVKWEKAADYEGNEASYDISNPVLEGVTISNSTAQTVESGTAGLEPVQMVGTYSPVSVTADDKSILFLGDANTLYYSTVDRQIRSCRAYFSVPYIKANAGANARAFALSFDGKETAGILEVSANSNELKDDAWYSLDGVRLSGKPTQRGLYINNGRKVARVSIGAKI